MEVRSNMLERVTRALISLEGRAPLRKIYEEVLSQNPSIINNYASPKNFEASIRATIERYSSDTESFADKGDIFYSVYGKGRGHWGLRENNNEDELPEIVEETEMVQQVKVRKVQSKFRNKLIEKYKCTCPITHIKLPPLLVASHIKPWRLSKNHERLDENNGILLAAHIDSLFDRGEISFNEEGLILYKNEIISNLVRENFKLKNDRIDVSEKMATYLSWHRDHFEFDN